MTALAPAAPAGTGSPPPTGQFIDGLVKASRLGEEGAPMLDVALALVNGGWATFPCALDKSPLVATGFKARACDAEQVQQWWTIHPHALPAICPGDGGLAALDVDSMATATAVRKEGISLTAGFIVETAGTSQPFDLEGLEHKPMHVYITATEQPSMPPVVARFLGGYVIAPGARRGDRVYRVVSDDTPAIWTRSPNAVPAIHDPRPTPSLERVEAAVACIPNLETTDREFYVTLAHMIKGAIGDAGRDIFLDWASKYPGVVETAEDARVFDTIKVSRLGPSALWRLAESHGFDAQEERLAEMQDDFDDDVTTDTPIPKADVPKASLHARLGTIREALAAIPDALEREIRRAQELGDLASKGRVPFRTLEQLLAAFDAPHRVIRSTIIRPGPELRDAIVTAPPDALVPGYLYVQAQHILFGEPGAFKTFLALDWALHVASGLPWLNQIPVSQRGVVFFAGEAASRLRIRIAAWCAARGISVEQAASLPFALIDTVPTLGLGDDGLQDAIARIREATNDPALLVFDNMTRMAAQSGLSIVNPSELGRILAGLDTLARTTGGSTLTICHSPMSDKGKVAGSYPIMGNPDVVLQAVRGGGLKTNLRSAKTRDVPAVESLMLNLREQDVTEWLRASFVLEGQALPASLEVSDFEDVGPSANPDGRVPSAVTNRRTSLVIEPELRKARAITAAAENEVSALGENRDWVCRVLAAHPEGLGKRAIRNQVQLGHGTLDAILDELEDEDVITVTRGRRHLYRLAGPTGADPGAAATKTTTST